MAKKVRSKDSGGTAVLDRPAVVDFGEKVEIPKTRELVRRVEMDFLPMHEDFTDSFDNADSGDDSIATVKMTEQREFLRHFRRFGIPSYSCALAGISLNRMRRWLETDPEFQREYNDALQISNDRVHLQSVLRGVEGYTEITETDKVDRNGNPYTEVKRRNVYDSTALANELNYRQPQRKVRIDVTSGNESIKYLKGIDLENDI